jgi:serine/threonine protein kinase
MVERDVEEQKLSTEAHNCVYRALDKETKLLVVVKLMCQDHDNEEGLSLSSLREISILKSLNHPNIVGVVRTSLP